jgi:hypothetical protein
MTRPVLASIHGSDPLSCNVPLPLEAEYFPMGHSLRIASDSVEVVSAAARLWSRFPKLSDTPPVRLKVMVSSNGARRIGPPPVFRGQENLLSIVCDHHNFAVADLKAGAGFACLSADTAADSAYLRYYFLEPLGYVLIAARYFAFLHASCIALSNRTVLLCGESGAGKTCLAFACARKGWSFLSGDAAAIVRAAQDLRVIGRPFELRFRHSAASLFPELAGLPKIVRPNGKADIEIDPQELGLVSTVEGQASHVVFLERDSGFERASTEFVLPAEARGRLQQAICFGDAAIRQEQQCALERLLVLPLVRLRYSNLDFAERALRSLVLEI